MSSKEKTIKAYIAFLSTIKPLQANNLHKVGQLYFTGWATYESVLAELQGLKNSWV